MTIQEALILAALQIGFGALAGGLTNAVAVWMLFHPYTPRGWWKLKIQGAIPKNRERLARAIGRTVGERLLTAEDLTRHLNAGGARDAFEKAVRAFLVSILETERGSLRQEMPPPLLEEVERVLDSLAPSLAARLSDYMGTERFQSTLSGIVARVAEDLGGRPLGELFTTARRAAVRERVEKWVADAVASADLDRTVGDWVDRQVERAAGDHVALLERLPPALVTTVEHGVAQYLPVALERLAGVLADPEARARVERALHQLFQRFAEDLLFHQRIVARLVVTEKTITRLLDTFDREGVDHLARLLEEPEMRTRVARSVNDAVVSFLRRPLADHIAALGPERMTGLRNAVVRAVTGALRDPSTRAYAIERLDHALAAVEHRTLGDVLRRVPPDKTAEWLAGLLAGEEARGWMTDGVRAAADGILVRPIGRPADWLPSGSIDRLAGQLATLLWDWLQRRIPEIVAQLNVTAVVEEKVRGFSLERLEQLIRSVTQRELDIIVRLGYLLGALVGAAAFASSLLVR